MLQRLLSAVEGIKTKADTLEEALASFTVLPAPTTEDESERVDSGSVDSRVRRAVPMQIESEEDLDKALETFKMLDSLQDREVQVHLVSVSSKITRARHVLTNNEEGFV